MIRLVVLPQMAKRANRIEQERLRLPVAEPVLRVMRVRHENDHPLSYEQIVLPLARFPGLSDSPVTADISELAKRYALSLGLATERVETVIAPHAVARHLRVQRRTRLLKLDRIVETTDGQPVEWRIMFTLPH